MAWIQPKPPITSTRSGFPTETTLRWVSANRRSR